MYLMLFEVPGLSLGTPKTEKNNKTECDSSTDKTDTKKYKKQILYQNSSGSLSKSKPRNIKTGEAAEWSKKLNETSSKTASPNTFPKKIEKQSGKSKLQQKMEEKLRGARFRYLNQKLYQSHSLEALNHFKEHPEDFQKVIYSAMCLHTYILF